MPRPATPLHKLSAQKRRNQAYVLYRGKRWSLGPWDTVHDRPSEEAERKLQCLKAQWRLDPNAGLTPTDDLLLIELWKLWTESPQGPGDRTSETTRCRLELFGTSAEPGPFLQLRVSEFSPGHLQKFQDDLCTQEREDGELRFGRYSVCRFVSLIRQCFDWGVIGGHVEQSQASALHLVKPPKKGTVKEPGKRGAVSWQWLDAVANHIGSEAAILLRVMWWCGARPGELCGLETHQVRRSGIVTTAKMTRLQLEDYGVWCAVLDDHKNAHRGKERFLFFGPRSQELLAALVDRGPGPLFRKASGKAYSSKQIQQYTRKACRRAGVSYHPPYCVDHAFLARVAAEFSEDTPGLGIIAAKAARNHSLRGITEVYTGADIVTAAKVAQKCG